MLFLLHGSDTSSSRQALLDLKKNYTPDSINVFDAKNFDPHELVRVCETPAMLSDRRLVILEGKFSLSTVNDQLSTVPPTTDLVFWTEEELKPSSKLVKLVRDSGGQIRLFKEKIPKHVFGFLDALGYKNKKKAFLELHRLLDQGDAPLYLLTMIVWQVRNLLRTQSAKGKVQSLHPYVFRKLKQQVKNFTADELSEIFRILLDAEVKLKTSRLDSVLILDQLVDKITS